MGPPWWYREAMSTWQAGARFAELFTIDHLVDEGPCGEVYAALDATGNMCRLRILPPDEGLSEEEREWFRIAMLALPQHAALPPIIAADVTGDGRAFAATRWVDGRSLADVIASRGHLSPEEARKLFADIAAALQVLHASGVGHSALSPDLVVIEPALRILDTRVLRWQYERVGGRPLGKVCSPLSAWYPWRRTISRGTNACADDVWSFALLVFFALTGRMYWESRVSDRDSYVALLDEVAHGAKEKATVRAGKEAVRLPEGFDDWFAWCMKPEPLGPQLAAAAAKLEALFDAPAAREREARQEAQRRALEEIEQQRRAERRAKRWRALLDEESEGQASLVELRHDASEGVAGGVRFILSSWVVEEDAMRAIVRAMIATARVLEGATRVGDGGLGDAIAKLWGRGGERRHQRLLEELDFVPPLRPSSLDPAWMRRGPCFEGGHAGLDAEGLTVEYAHEGWIGAHEKGWMSDPYARVPIAALPLDAEVFRAMMRAIGGAASSYDTSQTARPCWYCGRTLASIDMHDDTTCHTCAETYLGVIH
ncbi:Putative serine/threonine-protein kinase pknH [Minicystis rosea]|nr:Putative serine/threonine-protein kinase pknH [Minicystis rosea]